MSLPTKTPGQALPASEVNQLIHHVTGSPNRAVYGADGVWTVPDGCHRFKVTLCSYGGTSSSYDGGGDTGLLAGGRGGHSPMVSRIIDAEVGASYAITVNGFETKFGTLLSSTAGGNNSGPNAGPDGTSTGAELQHGNELFYLAGKPCGKGGQSTGGIMPENGGFPICVIEW